MKAPKRRRRVSEEWRAVPGFEQYAVSSHGRVRGHGGRLLSQQLTPAGYKRVYFSILGKTVAYFVHCLMLLAFVGPVPEGQETRHINGKRTANRLANLCYGTRRENALDRGRHGTQQRGERVKTSKLTWNAVRQIRLRYKAAPTYETIRLLAGLHSVSPRSVGRVVKGESWLSDPRAAP